MRLSMILSAGENEKFASGAWESQIGRMVPWNFRETDDGPVLGHFGMVKLISADVEEDGSRVVLEFEEVETDVEARAADGQQGADPGSG